MSLEFFDQFIRKEIGRNPSLGQTLQVKSNLRKCSQQFESAVVELHCRLIQAAMQQLFARVSSARMQELSSAQSNYSCETRYVASDSSVKAKSPQSRTSQGTQNEPLSPRWDTQSNNSQSFKGKQRSRSRRRSAGAQQQQHQQQYSHRGHGVINDHSMWWGRADDEDGNTKEASRASRRQQLQPQHQQQHQPQHQPHHQQQHQPHHQPQQSPHHQQPQQSPHQSYSGVEHLREQNDEHSPEHLYHEQEQRQADFAPQQQPQQKQEQQQKQQQQVPPGSKTPQQPPAKESPAYNYPTAGHQNRMAMASWYVANMDAKLSNLMRLFELIYRDTLRMCGACPSDLQQLRNALPDPTMLSMQQRVSGAWRPNFMNCKIDFLLHIAAMVYRNTQDIRCGCDCNVPVNECAGQQPPPPTPTPPQPPPTTSWVSRQDTVQQQQQQQQPQQYDLYTANCNHAIEVKPSCCCSCGCAAQSVPSLELADPPDACRRAASQGRKSPVDLSNNSNRNADDAISGNSRRRKQRSHRRRDPRRLFKAVRRSSALVLSPDGQSRACHRHRRRRSRAASRASSPTSTSLTAAAASSSTDTGTGGSSACFRVDIRMPL